MGIFSALKKAKEAYKNQKPEVAFSLGGGPLSISRAKREYREQKPKLTEGQWRYMEYDLAAWNTTRGHAEMMEEWKIEQDYEVLGEDEEGTLIVRKKKTWW